jgi:hypothetical protein
VGFGFEMKSGKRQSTSLFLAVIAAAVTMDNVLLPTNERAK